MDAADRLRPYVAGLAVDWLQTHPESRHRAVDGSLAFVDISGFTRLTERLAAKGKVGAEELSDLLDATFASLLGVAYSYGALLVKWGGDAVLLLFEGPDHERLAARAAHEMRALMRRIGRLSTSVGNVTLRMSVGVHSGSFDFFMAGQRHHELLIAGPSATVTAELEGVAEAGEIVVSERTAAALPGKCVGASKGAGFVLRSAPPVDPRCRFWPRLSEDFDFGSCLDPTLRAHLLEKDAESEHRQIAIAFVEVSAVDDLLLRQGPGAVANELHRLLTRVQDACDRHHVTFWETDISKDGFKILLIAGAPATTGHDEEGLLRAARAILDGHAGPIRLRVGANCGRAFVGDFGPDFRRSFSVKADAVNLAARVMAKAAPGQLLATETILARSATRFDVEPLEPFLVKGKTQPIRAAVVHRISADRPVAAADEHPFVGRSTEVGALLAAVDAAGHGHGRALGVTGDAGAGKSRLVDHVCGVVASDVEVVRGFADAYESSTAYYAVRRPLRAVVGLAPGAPDDVVVDRLRRRVAAKAPRLEPWLPLIAVPFGVDLPDTDETAAVQDSFRRSRSVGLLVEFLAAAVTTTTVFVVDDVHNTDEASAELLARLATESARRPWAVIVVGRDLPSPVDAAVEPVPVGPLGPDEARALVLQVPGGELLPPHVVRTIVDRAEGNPLFLRELATAASAADGAGALPDTLEELLAAQVDALAPAARTLLRTVSVLGTRFDQRVAAALVDEPPTDDQWRALDHFLARHDDGTRRFRTTLMRDTAYEGLPFRRRVDLHGRAASALKERARVTGTDHAESLSLHSLAAQRYDDAWHYSCVAGERARRVYANVDALTFYRRALDAARRLDHLSDADIAQVHETLGDLHARLADLEPAIREYRTARSRSPRDAVAVRARLALSSALVCARAGSTSTSLRWLTAAERSLAAAADRDDPDVGSLWARVAVERAFVRHVQGRAAEARRLCRSAIDVATRVGAGDVLGRALHLADLVAMAAGEPGDEASVERALALFEAAGDLPRQAGAWNHLGIRAYYAGDWDVAVDRYAKARAVHERSGDEWSAAISSANIAEILVDQGRLADAEPLVSAALQVWRASGTPSDIGVGAALLGRLYCRSGRLADGLGLLSEAAAAYGVKDQRFDIVDVASRIVEALLLRGAADAALQRLDEVEQMLRGAARAAGIVHGEPAGLAPLPAALPFAATVERLHGVALVQLGAAGEGVTHLRHSLDIARGRSAIDVLQSLDGLVWAGVADAAVVDERDELQRRLGVVWMPAYPRTTAPPDTEPLALLPRQEAAAPLAV